MCEQLEADPRIPSQRLRELAAEALHGRIGALPQRLVWDREAAIATDGRPTEAFAAFCGQLGVGWIILESCAMPRPKEATREPWPGAAEQRCTVHALRNLTSLPERHHRDVKARYW